MRSCMQLLYCLAVLVSSSVLQLCHADDGTTATDGEVPIYNNIVYLNRENILNKFVELLDRFGISPSTGPMIFAPSQTAWNDFREDDQDRWTRWVQQAEWIVHMQHLLLWHISIEENVLRTRDIFNGNRQLIENLHGNITIDQRFNTLDGVPESKIILPDVRTSDGMIHVIDETIIPPYLLRDMVFNVQYDRSAKFDLSHMANIALHVGLDEQLNAFYENGITFLVPPNRRFNRVEIDVAELLAEENREYARDFILSHMIDHNYPSAHVFALNEENEREQFLINSWYGTNMWVTTTESKLRFQSADVLVADQPTRNGIFHVIDFPLAPPAASDFVQFTSISTNWDTSDCYRFFRQALLSSQDIAAMFGSNVTVWCPTREAFAFFNNEDFNRLLEPIWVRHATEFLLNHISVPAMSRAEAISKAPGEITMLSGQTYELRKSGDRPRIKNGSNNQARSYYGDLLAIDGYVHLLDTAITPTAVSQSIYDQSRDNPDFKLLTLNIDFVDLTDIVDRDLPLTMLAPDNTAWRRIEFGVFEGADILKRHLFRGLLFMDVIANETQITAVNGITHAVDVKGPNNEYLFIGDAYVYQGDILARNGIIHYVDRVIGELYPTEPPSVSPQPTITATPTIWMPPTAEPEPTTYTYAVPIALPPARRPTLPPRPTRPRPDSSAAASTTAVTILSFVVISILSIVNML